jgi:hypothetical protein
MLSLTTSSRALPVPQANIRINFFRSSLGSVYWSPFVYTGGALFCSDPARILKIVTLALKQARKQALNVHLVTFSAQAQETYQKFRNKFTQVDQEDSLASVLTTINGAGLQVINQLKEENKSNIYREPLLMILLLEESQELELQEQSDRLEAILTRAKGTRINLLIITSHASAISQRLRRGLSWGAYLGEDNEHALEQLIPQHKKEVFNENRVVLGLFWSPVVRERRDLLLPIHALGYEPSPYKLESDAYALETKLAYGKLLSKIKK